MRTNKTTQAINRALNTPSNPMHVPRTLATTFGYELTFMPAVFDKMYHASKGQIKAWHYYSSYTQTQATMMNQMCSAHYPMAQRARRWEQFKTDPNCVEVTTVPTNNGPRLRETVKRTFALADMCDLIPRADHTRGGGAHLHVGIPYKGQAGYNDSDDYVELNAEPRAFAAAMQHELLLNPWLAWAFANPLDDNNAQQLRNMCKRPEARGDTRSAIEERAEFMRKKVYYILDSFNDIRAHADEIIRQTNQMHEARNWIPKYALYPMEYSCAPDDIYDYVRYRNRAKKKFARECKELLAVMEKEYALHVLKLHEEAIAEDAERSGVVIEEDTRPMYGCENYPVTKWCDISTQTGKCYAITHRQGYNTMEFRCFMMYEHHADHAKQITLANELVKRTLHKLKTMEGVRMYEPLKAPTLHDMKYSDAKRAFRNMLHSLGIDADYYREECVNIALRKRALRARKISI